MWEMLISLVVVAIITTITPGPSTLLVAAAGMRYGFRRSVPLMAGVTVGLISVMALSAGGLAALLQSAPTLHVTMKAIGSGYLVWLAWRIAQSGAPRVEPTSSALPVGFGAGLVVLCLNPKAWLMALSAAAAYAGLTDGPMALAVLLGAVFGIAAALALALWCAGGHALRRRVKKEGQWLAVNRALGVLTVVSVVPLWL